MTPLTTTTRSATAGPLLAITGDLDYETVGQLRDILTTIALRPGQLLVVDLGGMTFCDSSGLAALIAARTHAHAAGAEIALAAVPQHTLRVLRVVGLDQVFRLQPASDAQGSPEAGHGTP
ncbi:STAS domain-containing protein [Streptomyces sp. SID9727]|uniref:STAS domain-containing protein n=1 Tax=Streptomyces sp. SID9727 TaxID=2706114 RepID=UPI0013CA89AE|nr:STAS domain-containing protein [Streptomyces sp. SID9727]NEC68815.1 STAS domain-containing protein [Streptomyces sp. SID9727]